MVLPKQCLRVPIKALDSSPQNNQLGHPFLSETSSRFFLNTMCPFSWPLFLLSPKYHIDTPKKSRKVFNRTIGSRTYIRLVFYYHILGQWFIFRHLNNVSHEFYYNIKVSENGVLTYIAKVLGGETF